MKRLLPGRALWGLPVLAAWAAMGGAADLGSCRALEADLARLECYDRLADGQAEAAASVVDAHQAETAAVLEAKVSNVDRNSYGKAILELSNRQVWAQVDSGRLSVSAGDSVRIEPAASGSFLLEKATGSRKIRVKRID